MISLRKTVVLSGVIAATVATSVVSLPAQAQEFNAGNLVGGVAGALIGSSVGRGNGRLAATAAGGILGAVIGGNVERASGYYPNNSAPQQSYYNQYPQQATPYQNRYDTVSQPVYSQPSYAPVYVQPSYAQPVYSAPAYVYAQPQVTYQYSRSYDHRDRDDHGRHDWREQRGEWHGHDRGEGWRGDR